MNQQNESPFNNPKFLLAILLTFLALWGWQYYITKNYPAPTANTAVNVQNQPVTTSVKEPAKIESQSAIIKNETDLPEKTFAYDDENISWTLSSNGLGLVNYQLKKYKDRNNNPIFFKAIDQNIFSLNYKNSPVHLNVVEKEKGVFIGEGLINGKKITRTITFNPETKAFTSTIQFEEGIDQLAIVFKDQKHTSHKTTFFVPSFEKQDFLYNNENNKIKTETIISHKEGEVFEKSIPSTNLTSIGSQYFTLALIDKSEVLPNAKLKIENNIASVDVNYNLQSTKIKNVAQVMYIGPKSNDLLSAVDPLLPEVMDYGMFGFISRPLLSLMKFLHSILGNWGLAIIGLTLIVRLILLPFNVMSFKSSRAMMKIQPLLKDARERYKDDPMRINRETMAIMKEHKANPLSGCLPMLIQIPIFFALWRAIGSSIEIYQQPFLAWITDLSAPDRFFVLPILMGITMFFQQKLTPTTMDPMQAKILNFMPIIFTIFMVGLPSGLTLYNFVSALFGVIQQYFLLKDRSIKSVQVTT